jgi:hypothetical protein
VPFSRRSFLLGSAAAITLAACGSKGDDTGSQGGGGGGEGATPTSDAGLPIGGGTSPSAVVVIRRFQAQTLVTGAQRVPLVLGDVNGLLPLNATPATLSARVLDANGRVVVDSVTAQRHGQDVEQPYFPFALSLETAGVYDMQFPELPGATASVDVFGPADVPIPQVGSALPPFDTPTTKDHRGVDPICTRDPACSLHDITLTDALAKGKPVAYLIGTPAYCSTAICGPVLELLLDQKAKRKDFSMVHAEVYTDDTLESISPAVTAYHMTFEPSLFVADAQSTIVARLDSIWDTEELNAALDLAAGNG